MTPAMFQFFKFAATMPGSASPARFAKLTFLLATSYTAAIAARDQIYWPIVVQVYTQVNRIDAKRAYEAKQALTLLQTMQIQRDHNLHVKATGGSSVAGEPRVTLQLDKFTVKDP